LKRFSNNKFQISYAEHLKIFDGLSTKDKLTILVKNKKITENNIIKILNFKQELTKKELKKKIKYNLNLYNLFKILSKKYILAIATNSIDETLNICIKKLKLNKFIKFKIGTEILKNKKTTSRNLFKMLDCFGSKPFRDINIRRFLYR
jgi:hypothetical protein